MRIEMDDAVFDGSAKLADMCGDAPVPGHGTVREALRFHGVSLWEVIAPHLALCRFPRSVARLERTYHAGWFEKAHLATRPYVGRWTSQRWDPVFTRNHRADSQAAEHRDILFINYQPIFFRETYQPVASHLAETHGMSSLILEMRRSHDIIGDGLVQHQSAMSYDDAELWQTFAKDHASLKSVRAQCMRAIKQHVGKAQWTFIRHDVRWLFAVECVRLLRHLSLAHRVMQQCTPSIVISPDDSEPRPRLYTLLARAQGIPSLVMQQGLVGARSVEWRFFSSDRLATYGTQSATAIQQHGLEQAQMTLTGCPRFDVLREDASDVTRALREKHGVSDDKQLVLLASQPAVPGAFSNASTRIAMLRAIRRVTQRMPHVHLLVKPHPVEPIDGLKDIFQVDSNTSFADGALDIRDLARATDCMVTFFSTSGLLALIAGKPLVCVQFAGEVSGEMYTATDAVFTARTEKDIAMHLEALCGAEREAYMAQCEAGRKALVDGWVGAMHADSSTKRVSDVVCEMICH